MTHAYETCHFCGLPIDGTRPFCESRSLTPTERFPCDPQRNYESSVSKNYADYLDRRNRARSRGMIIPSKKRK